MNSENDDSSLNNLSLVSAHLISAEEISRGYPGGAESFSVSKDTPRQGH